MGSPLTMARVGAEVLKAAHSTWSERVKKEEAVKEKKRAKVPI